MKNLTIIYTACSLFVILSHQITFAGTLPLTANKMNKIKIVCEGCLTQGVMICGDNKIGFGKKFVANFFQGTPSNGYFITPPYLAAEYKKTIRAEANYSQLKTLIRNRLMELNLIVVGDDFNQIYSISNPKVAVVIPEQLHNCLKNPENKWGCGVSENRSKECCEKKLGSAIVTVTWIDIKNHEIIELLYNPSMGSSTLVRKFDNKIKAIYYCNTTESGIFAKAN